MDARAQAALALALLRQLTAGQQAGLASLMANLVRADVPDRVQSARERLLNLHLPTAVPPNADAVKAAFLASGLFTTATSAEDLSTALSNLGAVLKIWREAIPPDAANTEPTPQPVPATQPASPGSQAKPGGDATASVQPSRPPQAGEAQTPARAPSGQSAPPNTLDQPATRPSTTEPTRAPSNPALLQAVTPRAAQDAPKQIGPSVGQTQSAILAAKTAAPPPAETRSATPARPEPSASTNAANAAVPVRAVASAEPAQPQPKLADQTNYAPSKPQIPAQAAAAPIDSEPPTVADPITPARIAMAVRAGVEIAPEPPMPATAAARALVGRALQTGMPQQSTAQSTQAETPAARTVQAPPPTPAVPSVTRIIAQLEPDAVQTVRAPMIGMDERSAPLRDRQTAPRTAASAPVIAADEPVCTPEEDLATLVAAAIRAAVSNPAPSAASSLVPSAAPRVDFLLAALMGLDAFAAPTSEVPAAAPPQANGTPQNPAPPAPSAQTPSTGSMPTQTSAPPASPSAQPSAPGSAAPPSQVAAAAVPEETLPPIPATVAAPQAPADAPEDAAPDARSSAARASLPPPFRGGPLTGQPATAPTLPANASPAATATQLLSETSAALARQTLLQIASLPDAQQPSRPQSAQWMFEVPLMTPQGSAVAHVMIERDGSHQSEEVRGPIWRVQFAVDVEPLGPVRAGIALSGERTWVTLSADRPESVQKMRAGIARLDEALRAQSLSAEIAFQSGFTPEPPARPAAFVDRAS